MPRSTVANPRNASRPKPENLYLYAWSAIGKPHGHSEFLPVFCPELTFNKARSRLFQATDAVENLHNGSWESYLASRKVTKAEFQEKIDEVRRWAEALEKFQTPGELGVVVQVADSNLPVSERTILKLARMAETGTTLSAVADFLDMSPSKARAIVLALQSQGYNLSVAPDSNTVSPNLSEGGTRNHLDLTHRYEDADTFTIGVVSDEHISSIWHNNAALHYAYDLFEARGVTTVLSAGNYIDGYIKKINGQTVYESSSSKQYQRMMDIYPRRPGITTYFVSGDDHEGWFKNSEGLDPVAALAAYAEKYKRDDIASIGYIEADIVLNKTVVRVHHAGMGSAYALSYRPQKIIESFRVSGDTPDLVIIGHYHKMEFGNWLQTWYLQAGTFQHQSDFMRKRTIAAHVGFWIVTIKADRETGQILSILPEAITLNQMDEESRNFRPYHMTQYQMRPLEELGRRL